MSSSRQFAHQRTAAPALAAPGLHTSLQLVPYQDCESNETTQRRKLNRKCGRNEDIDIFVRHLTVRRAEHLGSKGLNPGAVI